MEKNVRFKLFIQEKPSKTAFIAAWLRAWSHIDFKNQKWGPDYLAEYFVPLHVRLLTKSRIFRASGTNSLNKSSPGIYEYIIARTLFIDEVFSQALKDCIPQIVFLGAGYDSRAIRFEGLNIHTRVIELDMAATQRRKIKCLKKYKISIPEYLKFSTIDFNIQSLDDCLTSAGYQKGTRTLFIWEGVTMYLEEQSVKDTLAFIQQSSTSDSLLVFDYAVSIPGEDIHKYHGAKEMLKTMKNDHKNEPLTFFLDEKTIEEFLKERGHKIIRHLNKDTIEETYLKDTSGSSIGAPNGLFNMVITSPEP